MITSALYILLLLAGWILLILSVTQRNKYNQFIPFSRPAKRNTIIALAVSAAFITVSCLCLCVFLVRFFPAFNGRSYPDYIGGYVVLGQLFMAGFTFFGIIILCAFAFLCLLLVWTLILALFCGICIYKKYLVPTGFWILFLVLHIMNTFVLIGSYFVTKGYK